MTDLSDRSCIVTGATRGIGRETAAGLAAMGASVIVHGRNAAAVDKVCGSIARAAGHRRITGLVADFASLADVRRLASEILARHQRIDVLVNNAGLASSRRELTVDGHERTFAVNHLAPFLLTELLRERLVAGAPARIVNVASNAYRRGTTDYSDLNWERRKYSGLQAYSDSKMANVLFTLELARRLAGTGVTANCLHPGVVATHIFSGMGILGSLFGILSKPLLLPAAKGAKTSIYLASSPAVADVSGRFFDECAPKAVVPAADDEAAARLWTLSETLTNP